MDWVNAGVGLYFGKVIGELIHGLVVIAVIPSLLLIAAPVTLLYDKLKTRKRKQGGR